MSSFVKHLLNQPNVIVISRPSVTTPADLKPFDLELETIGFDSGQVSTYLEKVEPGSADAIRVFLDRHPLVRDLVRIPIQLDALCYAWNDVSEYKPETMTALYRAIERGLWRKDIYRLEKEDRPANENEVIPTNVVEFLVRDEAFLLEGLAFTGLYNDVIVFDAKFRAAVSEHFSQPGTIIDKTLRKLSYLRTSDRFAKEQNKTYHFLHLTLQEYFAARYFARIWKNGGSLTCLHLIGRNRSELDNKKPLRRGHKKVEDVDPGSFLQKYKYSARYRIVWRFVVGFLSSEADAGKDTLRFFDAIDMEPLDLLGPTHQRLAMHCLSEVPLSNDSEDLISIRHCLEERL